MKKTIMALLLTIVGGASAWAEEVNYALKPSKDLALRIGNSNQSGTGETIEVRENTADNHEYGFCGIMEFDLTDVQAKIAVGYTVKQVSLRLTDCSNNRSSKLAIRPFWSGWTEDKNTTYDKNATYIAASIAGDALTTVQLKRYGGKKAFELQGASTQVNPFPVSEYQGISTENANLIAYLTDSITAGKTAISVLVGRDDDLSTQNCGFYTKDVLNGLSGTKNCSQYEWSEAESKWVKKDGTDNSITRVAAAMQFFGLTEEEFEDECSPKLFITLAAPVGATNVVTAPGAGIKALDVNNFIGNNGLGTHNLWTNGEGNGRCVYTNANGKFFYIGRYNVDDIKAIRLTANTVNHGTNSTAISVNFYDTTENEINTSYLDDISGTLRNGKHTFFTLHTTATKNNGDNLWNNGFYRGAIYTADFDTRTISVDAAGFKAYWADETAEVNLTQTMSDESVKTSAFDKTATGVKDLFVVMNAQGGRAAVSDVVVYMADESTVTVPVTTMTAGKTVKDVNANMTAGILASSYLNTTGAAISAATLGNVTLTAANAAAFKTLADANVALTAANASYDLTVTDAGAATLVLPFASALPSGVEAYTLNYTAGNSSVKATEVETTLTANTPVLINAEAGNYTFSATDAAINTGAAAQGALTGVYAETLVPDGSYILTNHSGEIGFRKVDGTTNKVDAYRAYLTADGAGARLSISFDDESETTSIVTVPDGSSSGSPIIYDLQGRRVSQPVKGLYVKNGKKVVVK